MCPVILIFQVTRSNLIGFKKSFTRLERVSNVGDAFCYLRSYQGLRSFFFKLSPFKVSFTILKRNCNFIFIQMTVGQQMYVNKN